MRNCNSACSARDSRLQAGARYAPPVSADSPVAADLRLKRHRLVHLFPAAWERLQISQQGLVAELWLKKWADHHWPLIVRRPLPGETGGVSVELPLPSSAGKQRIALQVRRADIASVAPLPSLLDVIRLAPQGWRSSLRQLAELAQLYHMQSGVFGCLAWQRLTGLGYLCHDSDLDVVWSLPHRTQLTEFLTRVAEIESHAPMRIDGELTREDGACVNWRELHSGSSELALKSWTGARPCSVAAFVGT
jgi:phosphoribosyl-dephospho-CoA transferase